MFLVIRRVILCTITKVIGYMYYNVQEFNLWLKNLYISFKAYIYIIIITIFFYQKCTTTELLSLLHKSFS